MGMVTFDATTEIKCVLQYYSKKGFLTKDQSLDRVQVSVSAVITSDTANVAIALTSTQEMIVKLLEQVRQKNSFKLT